MIGNIIKIIINFIISLINGQDAAKKQGESVAESFNEQINTNSKMDEIKTDVINQSSDDDLFGATKWNEK